MPFLMTKSRLLHTYLSALETARFYKEVMPYQPHGLDIHPASGHVEGCRQLAHGKPTVLQHSPPNKYVVDRVYICSRHEAEHGPFVEVDQLWAEISVTPQPDDSCGHEEIFAEGLHVQKVGRQVLSGREYCGSFRDHLRSKW
jgi:hypothetical protein